MSGNTVFVVGAGASNEAKLPTGNELKFEIARLLDMRFDDWGSKLEHGDRAIVAALEIHVRQPNGSRGDINPYLHEAWHIRDALPLAISIDNFIDSHRENEKIALCGKLAIVRSILEAEKKSSLYFERLRGASNINFSSLRNTWYLPFFQLLTENCEKKDLKNRFKTVTLIAFNYDRCIEHFIYNALQNYYKIADAEAVDIVRSINIYHPYGSVGSLPWLDHKDTMEFGANPKPEQLLQLTQKIKTFTEGTDPGSSQILAIRKHMREANRLIFMGFAFHKLNMQVIAPGNDKKTDSIPKCYATTHGISESDKEVILSQISILYNTIINTRMANLPCGAFFTEFWRSLSF